MIVKCIICFAKYKTDKLMKGLLTGPVTTILLCSFFSRNDQLIYIIILRTIKFFGLLVGMKIYIPM
ncbi:hypothetical protein [Blattabacterium punctulatus]|uniref:hypothetical protein n=1 Tax=Blattabacterium punctulatus TaxID=164514 RepID=UPI0029373BBE|nr:hypothetical protein [Blattabacterium punctulatus]